MAMLNNTLQRHINQVLQIGTRAASQRTVAAAIRTAVRYAHEDLVRAVAAGKAPDFSRSQRIAHAIRVPVPKELLDHKNRRTPYFAVRALLPSSLRTEFDFDPAIVEDINFGVITLRVRTKEDVELLERALQGKVYRAVKRYIEDFVFDSIEDFARDPYRPAGRPPLSEAFLALFRGGTARSGRCSPFAYLRAARAAARTAGSLLSFDPGDFGRWNYRLEITAARLSWATQLDKSRGLARAAAFFAAWTEGIQETVSSARQRTSRITTNVAAAISRFVPAYRHAASIGSGLLVVALVVTLLMTSSVQTSAVRPATAQDAGASGSAAQESSTSERMTSLRSGNVPAADAPAADVPAKDLPRLDVPTPETPPPDLSASALSSRPQPSTPEADKGNTPSDGSPADGSPPEGSQSPAPDADEPPSTNVPKDSKVVLAANANVAQPNNIGKSAGENASTTAKSEQSDASKPLNEDTDDKPEDLLPSYGLAAVGSGASQLRSGSATAATSGRGATGGAREVPVTGIYYFEDFAVNFGNLLSLTFDDGPNTALMPDGRTVADTILDTLQKYEIKATFFVNGRMIVDEEGQILPEAARILRRIVDEGHQLGNHSFSHDNLRLDPYKGNMNAIAREIVSNQETVEEALGEPYHMAYFRPPYAEGGRSREVDLVVRALGLMYAFFQIDSFDYLIDTDDSEYSENVWDTYGRLWEGLKASTGGAVLMHELQVTAASLPTIIDALESGEASGVSYDIVPLDRLLMEKYGEVAIRR